MSDKPTVGRITFSPELDDAAKASREMGLAGSGVVLGPLFAAGYNAAAAEIAALQAERDRLAAELHEARNERRREHELRCRLAAELEAARAALERLWANGHSAECHREFGCTCGIEDAAAILGGATPSAGPALSGMQVVIDPTMPEGTAELRCGESRVPIVPSAEGPQS